MNAHTKPSFVVALDGIYKLGPDGHYARYEPEEHYRARGLILWASMLPGIAAIYGLWWAAQAWLA